MTSRPPQGISARSILVDFHIREVVVENTVSRKSELYTPFCNPLIKALAHLMFQFPSDRRIFSDILG